jgi:hypothetical protein
MKNILFIITEGDHDEGFLRKILRYEGFVDVSKKEIGKFEPFLQSYWLGQVKNYNYQEKNLIEKPLFPTPLEYGDTKVLIYSVGGNSERQKPKKLIKDLMDILPSDDGDNLEDTNLSIRILFIEDADKEGIPRTVEKISKDYSDVLGDISSLKNLKIIPHLVFQCIACYIFAGEDGYGKLEHIVVPLMETSNEEIFEKARDFLKTDPKIKKKDLDFDQLKAEIGVVGQLQKSGKSNTAIIQDTKYITEDKVQADAKCQEIIKFIKDVINFTPTNIDQQKVKKD